MSERGLNAPERHERYLLGWAAKRARREAAAQLQLAKELSESFRQATRG